MKKISISFAVFLIVIYAMYLAWSALSTGKEVSTIDAIKTFTIACSDELNFADCEKFYKEVAPVIFKSKGKTAFLNGITKDVFENKHKQLILKGAKIQSLDSLNAIENQK